MTARCGLALVGLAVVAAACGADSTVQVSGGPIDSPSSTSSTTSTTSPTSTSPTAPADDVAPTEPAVQRDPELGVGDELFPDLGSADVDVEAYTVSIEVDDEDRSLDATAVVVADVDLATDVLALDAVGLDVEGVDVDGRGATFRVADPELLIDLPADRDLTVEATIRYTFEPERAVSAAQLPVGWLPGDDHSYVLNEPDGARTWLPANDHPSDKAQWRFEIDPPAGEIAVANGALVQRGDASTPWIWEQDEPMPTYLVQVIVGDYEFIESAPFESIDGDTVPLSHVVPAGMRTTFDPAIDGIAEQLAFFEQLLGPYPLDRYGLAFVDDLSNLAMETQGRSMFGADDFAGGRLGYFQELLLSHELAHQWFGNGVSPAAWSDIWLNESFATYSNWLWLDHIGLQPLDSFATSMLRQRQSPGEPTGSPSVSDMFGFNRYDGGAVVVHALRQVLGDERFFELLQRWVADNLGTSRSTDDFVMLAEEIHGDDLTQFFDEWLYSAALPAEYPS